MSDLDSTDYPYIYIIIKRKLQKVKMLRDFVLYYLYNSM